MGPGEKRACLEKANDQTRRIRKVAVGQLLCEIVSQTIAQREPIDTVASLIVSNRRCVFRRWAANLVLLRLCRSRGDGIALFPALLFLGQW